MSYSMMLYCKETIKEIEAIVLGFKKSREIFHVDDTEFHIGSKHFNAFVYVDIGELEFKTDYYNNIFSINLDVAPPFEEKGENTLVTIYSKAHNIGGDEYGDDIITFVGELMRNISGDFCFQASDFVYILRHKNKTYIDTYRYGSDEFGYRFEKLGIEFESKHLTD